MAATTPTVAPPSTPAAALLSAPIENCISCGQAITTTPASPTTTAVQR